jgi:hypothetical protein
MRSSRFCAMLVLMSSCYAVGAGCGDDDDPANPGGTGGKTDAGAGRGGGGSSGRGGSAGSSAGSGGMGGGMMGSGGASGRGGTAGTAGTAGAAGTAGTNGTGGSSGATGTGGSAGMDASPDAMDASPDVSDDGGGGTDAGPDAPDAGSQYKRCVEKCDSLDDCAEADGAPSGLVCTPEGFCALSTDFPVRCTTNIECMIRRRPGGASCDASTPCASATQVCADGGGGRGKCIARAPADGGTCTSSVNPDRVTVNLLGGDGGTAEVCMNDANRCGPENECYTAVCQSDEDCSPQLGGPICNTQTGRCDCVTDNDCGSVPNTNKCINGVCGCSSAAACTVRTNPGTTVACE